MDFVSSIKRNMTTAAYAQSMAVQAGRSTGGSTFSR